jgi:hypothetical protein
MVMAIGAVTALRVPTTSTQPPQQPTIVADTLRLAHMMCSVLDSAISNATSDSAATSLRRRRRDCTRRVLRVATLARLSRKLMDIHWGIPEYHDEQRLRDGQVPNNPNMPGLTKFGPVASVYAVPQVAGYNHGHEIESQSPRGALVAYVIVDDPGSGVPLPDSYKRLFLQPGVNCVWVGHDRTAPPNQGWFAYVEPATLPDTACNRDAPLPSGQPLAVVRASVSGNIPDYPAVARFGEGVVSGPGGADLVQPLIGVICLNGWCEIGPANFRPGTPVPTDAFAHLPGGARERKIAGWYDDQWLSDDASPTPLLRAALIPQPNLDALSEHSFGAGTHVATIYLFSSPPAGSKYAQWGLHQGRNQLWIKGTGTKWESWIVSGTPPVRTRWSVERHRHFDEAVPGTARFRWAESPNGMWTPCGAACCDDQGIS